MKKLILIKYGELTTKHDNINFFIKTLKNNISAALENITHEIKYDIGRMFIETSEYDKVKEILLNIFGIHEINIAYELDDNSFDSVSSNLLDLLREKDFETFKVTTKRSDKNYPLNSMEVSRKLGGVILKNISNKRVDVNSPNLLINIELRVNKAYIYFEKEKGIGGYPVGTLGKGMLMLSGGIDSPVAGFLAMKRGIRLEAVYFDAPPHTSLNAKNKVLELAEVLAKYSGYLKVHVIRFTEIEEAIYKKCPKEYMITLMRRQMYRITEKLAHKCNAKAIINGESVGQVASQTLTSMAAINDVTLMPVLRPVCCFDKLEIIDLANKIGTYNISIRPYEDCCTIFVPKHPIINPNIKLCQEYEKLIDFETMIKTAVATEEVIKLPQEKEEFANIL